MGTNESKTPWTPGPWRKTGSVAPFTIHKGIVPIATVHNGANADLIAAAPEMAALVGRLRGALDVVLSERNGPEPAYLTETMDDARALLARVRGE